MRLILIFLFLCNLALASENYYQINEKRVYLLGKKSSRFIDTNKSMPIELIQKQNFTLCNEDAPAYGYADIAYWLKVQIQPSVDVINDHWYLKIDYPLLDHLELYVYNSKNKLLLRKRSGEFEPYSQRDIEQRFFVFGIPFNSTEPLTFYLRIETSGSIQIPIKLLRDVDIIEEEQSSLLLSGMYYGIFLIIFIYNLILYSYTWDKNYILYLLFLSSFVMWQLSFDGLGVMFFWTDVQWNIEHGTAFWMVFSAFTALLFSRVFLRTSFYAPRLDKLLLFFIGISFIVTILSIFVDYTAIVRVGVALTMIASIIMLVSGVITYRKGNKAARFYILGWSFFLIGSFLLALNKLDVIGSFYFMNEIQKSGSAFEMLFLSWALADRIYLLQNEYNVKLEKLNITLKERVENALLEMRKKDQILAHQTRLASIGETIEQIAHQWRQPLNNLALINQDLYFKKQLGTLDDESFEKAHIKTDENLQFMSQTIDDFRNFFNTDEGDELITCKPSLFIKNALVLSEASLRYSKIDINVECINENEMQVKQNEMTQVIMNLIKNSTDALRIKGIENGWIKIIIDTDKNYNNITFSDNAGGIEALLLPKIFDAYVSTKKADGGTGIGLYMSKLIVEKYGGTLSAENTQDGIAFKINFSTIF